MTNTKTPRCSQSIIGICKNTHGQIYAKHNVQTIFFALLDWHIIGMVGLAFANYFGYVSIQHRPRFKNAKEAYILSGSSLFIGVTLKG